MSSQLQEDSDLGLTCTGPPSHPTLSTGRESLASGRACHVPVGPSRSDRAWPPGPGLHSRRETPVLTSSLSLDVLIPSSLSLLLPQSVWWTEKRTQNILCYASTLRSVSARPWSPAGASVAPGAGAALLSALAPGWQHGDCSSPPGYMQPGATSPHCPSFKGI